MVASPAGRSCQLARQCGDGRDCGLGALQRERKVTTAALKALRCSASGGGVDFVIILLPRVALLFTTQNIRKRKRPCRCPIHLKQRLIFPCASTEPCARVLRVIPTGIAACPARTELFPQLTLFFPAISRHRNPRRFPPESLFRPFHGNPPPDRRGKYPASCRTTHSGRCSGAHRGYSS